MSRSKSILKPILLGMTIALLLLFIFPELKEKNRLMTTLLTEESTVVAPVFSFNSAIKKAAPSVVIIYASNTSHTQSNTLSMGAQKRATQKGLGSGIIMNEQGFILTNHHVIDGFNEFGVFLQDTRRFDAHLIGVDKRTDLAILKITASNLPVIPQDEEYVPNIGDLVLAIGNPFNLGQSATLGIISGTERNNVNQYQQQELIQTDAAINQGNSGGALINSNGVLVGINTIAFKDETQEAQGIGFAIPYSTAKYVMTQIIADGRVIRGYLGFNGREVIEKSINAPQNYGFRITSISPNSPAQKAGLQLDDIITSINDKPIYITNFLFKTLQQLKPGTTVTLTVFRDQEKMTIPIVVEEELTATE